ncbi:MAG: hypothetical protein U5J83_14385 [Bryobacterales bacterium]|nr:hypothetical protein [Bryobacterales bacterium]
MPVIFDYIDRGNDFVQRPASGFLAGLAFTHRDEFPAVLAGFENRLVESYGNVSGTTPNASRTRDNLLLAIAFCVNLPGTERTSPYAEVLAFTTANDRSRMLATFALAQSAGASPIAQESAISILRSAEVPLLKAIVLLLLN